jgi:asparagine synthase (glutamine-hydrolysing)
MSFFVIFSQEKVPAALSAECRLAEVDVLHSSANVVFLATNAEQTLPSRVVSASCKDAGVFLVGRIRLDDRKALSEKLGIDTTHTDSLLCLRSYVRWGTRCTEHIQGDFCFVVWDMNRHTLLCARDHLGVRPLFYATFGKYVLVSDSLEEIRQQTLVSELDDCWVADFLTHGYSQEFHRSAYKDVRRVPPAHVLKVSPNSFQLRRYWRLELNSPLFFSDSRNYVDLFNELLACSIKDRLPQGVVGIQMSGGLDSTALATKTVQVLGNPNQVVAETRYFNELIADAEARISSSVATALHIRHVLTPVDGTFYDRLWCTREINSPEPRLSAVRMGPERSFAVEMAKEASVWFYGEGPDNALVFEWRAYLNWLWKKKDWKRFYEAFISGARVKPLREWPGSFKNHVLRRLRRKEFSPRWIQPELSARRAAEIAELSNFSGELNAAARSWHPRAVGSFSDPIWQEFLEGFDYAMSGTPLDWRHPYLDIRLLYFMLSVPPIPWARRKLLIRQAMKGMLPQEVLLRDKTPLAEDPCVKIILKEGIPGLALSKDTRRYVEEAMLPRRPKDASEVYDLLRVRILDHWLRNRGRKGFGEGVQSLTRLSLR